MISWFNWFSLLWLEGCARVFQRSRHFRYQANTKQHLFNKKKPQPKPNFFKKTQIK